MKTRDAMTRQLQLFPDEETRPRPRRKTPTGGSSNPIVFHDYESFVAKFRKGPKTTDDTFTPRDVYEAVVRYVGEVFPLEGKEILRPFYPGGDYERAAYPEDGVVIDNPPFSMFTKICAFYAARRIPFFLFGPGLTIASCCKYCTAVVVGRQLTFANGAAVKCNFASNLFGDTVAMTAPELAAAIAACPSQRPAPKLPKYEYPPEVLSVSDMQTLCRGGISFSVGRDSCRIIRNLDLHPKRGGLFGDHLLLSEAEAKAKAKAEADRTVHIGLSARERLMVEQLGKS